MSKICSKCHLEKQDFDFYYNGSRCKKCHNLKQIEAGREKRAAKRALRNESFLNERFENIRRLSQTIFCRKLV